VLLLTRVMVITLPRASGHVGPFRLRIGALLCAWHCVTARAPVIVVQLVSRCKAGVGARRHALCQLILGSAALGCAFLSVQDLASGTPGTYAGPWYLI